MATADPGGEGWVDLKVAAESEWPSNTSVAKVGGRYEARAHQTPPGGRSGRTKTQMLQLPLT